MSGDVINFSILDPVASVPKGNQFIPNPNANIDYVEDIYIPAEEDGCDIYIDEFRHLPENVSCIKLVAKIVASNGKE
jgi:hypothetical protein